jgi:hypothetical protein
METKQSTIELNVPQDGSSCKYITGINEQGQRVVRGRSVNRHYQLNYGNLTDVRGGWVRFKRGRYRFSGSSGDYGRADHKAVSDLVNPKQAALEWIVDEALTAKERVESEIAWMKICPQDRDDFINNCIGGFELAILAYNVAMFGYHGYTQSNFSTPAIATSIGLNAAAITAEGFRPRQWSKFDNIAGAALSHGIIAGIAYGVGYFIRAAQHGG